MKNKLPLLFFGEFAINVGRGTLTLVLGAFLYKETGGLWAFALAFFSEFLVAIFIQGVAGSVVDKKGPEGVLNLALGSSSLIVLVCWLLLVGFGQVANVLVVGAVALNVIRPFIRTSVFALLPAVFPKRSLEKANGYASVALQIGQITGMLAAGLCLEFGSVVLSFLMIFASFFVSTVCYGILGNQMLGGFEQAQQQQPGMRWSDHVALILDSKLRPSYLVGSFDFALIAIFNLLLAPVVAQNFNDLPRWLTILDGAFALGALAAGVMITRMSKDTGVSYRYSLIAQVAAMALFISYAIKLPAVAILALIVIFGFSTTISVVVWSTNLQKHAPSQYRGRVASVKYIVNALAVATPIAAVSWANERSFEFAAWAAATLTSLLIVVTALYGLSRWKIMSKIETNPKTTEI